MLAECPREEGDGGEWRGVGRGSGSSLVSVPECVFPVVRGVLDGAEP